MWMYIYQEHGTRRHLLMICTGRSRHFYVDFAWKGSELNQVELAAWTHAEFVHIHPFPDGNGKISRFL